MQKFGLDTLKSEKLTAIELEIVKEQATSLGRAGRKLRLALEEYEKKKEGCDSERKDALIENVSQGVWELILQREFTGFLHGNLEWIKKHYDIPEEVYSRLGSKSATSK